MNKGNFEGGVHSAVGQGERLLAQRLTTRRPRLRVHTTKLQVAPSKPKPAMATAPHGFFLIRASTSPPTAANLSCATAADCDKLSSAWPRQ
jgi:hypothetical protein